jgi:hypothetical protein
VEFVVAPYEADAQLAYLARSGAVHAVLTEDSDMLPYGCPRVSTTVAHCKRCASCVASRAADTHTHTDHTRAMQQPVWHPAQPRRKPTQPAQHGSPLTRSGGIAYHLQAAAPNHVSSPSCRAHTRVGTAAQHQCTQF